MSENTYFLNCHVFDKIAKIDVPKVTEEAFIDQMTEFAATHGTFTDSSTADYYIKTLTDSCSNPKTQLLYTYKFRLPYVVDRNGATWSKSLGKYTMSGLYFDMQTTYLGYSTGSGHIVSFDSNTIVDLDNNKITNVLVDGSRKTVSVDDYNIITIVQDRRNVDHGYDLIQCYLTMYDPGYFEIIADVTSYQEENDNSKSYLKASKISRITYKAV